MCLKVSSAKWRPFCLGLIVLNGFIGNPDSKVHGANMGPTWDLSALCEPHVGPMNFAILEVNTQSGGNGSVPPGNKP